MPLNIRPPDRLPCGHDYDPICPCACRPVLAGWTLRQVERPEEDQMVIARLLPSYERSMFLGQERAGKSTMGMPTAVCIATGTDLLGHYRVPKQRPVIYVSAEDRTALLRRRALGILRAHHADMSWAACEMALAELEQYASLLLIGKDFRHPDS